MVSPKGSWQLVFEVDGRESYIEELEPEGAVVRFRTKNVDTAGDAVFIALMEIDCEASTASDGAFMVEYGSAGEFRSFIKEESPSWSPVEGEYMSSIEGALCEGE